MQSPKRFYGGTSRAQTRIENILRKSPISPIKKLPTYLSTLLGPSRTWRTFSKQSNALEFCKGELMAFAFELPDPNCPRRFLVCHPVMLNYVLSKRPSSQQCTYEIIQEAVQCKLYLDIEFEYAYNQISFMDGERMQATFLLILERFLNAQFNISCNEQDFLDLDSSDVAKFSRHVILNARGAVFSNNHIVGNVVKFVCEEITAAIDCGMNHYYGIPVGQLEKLFVIDRKGTRKIFIDLGVYTRNRHFRIFGSTKMHKNRPLTISASNKFKPDTKMEYDLFLYSLVTYLHHPQTAPLDFGSSPRTMQPSSVSQKEQGSRVKVELASDLDHFISKMISPRGSIRRRTVLSNKICYDVLGYRYCSNIGREHKSNNVYFIVDVKTLTFYQACYDPDCKGFQSSPKALPLSICLPVQDELILQSVMDNMLTDDILRGMTSTDDLFSVANNDEDDDGWDDALLNAMEGVDDRPIVPDMGLSDNELLSIPVTFSVT